jgi:hypothetical protein
MQDIREYCGARLGSSAVPPQVSRVHMHLGVISQLYSLTLQTKGIAASIVAQELPAQELPVLEELQHAILLPTKPLCQ